MNQLYQQYILDNYKNPQNAGRIDNATHLAKLNNYSCGDEISVSLNVSKDKVRDLKHETRGCAICMASASIISEYVKGKSPKEILKIDSKKVQELLGIELTASRLKCAMLPVEAMKKALG